MIQAVSISLNQPTYMLIASRVAYFGTNLNMVVILYLMPTAKSVRRGWSTVLNREVPIIVMM
jgi:hypothetical protein